MITATPSRQITEPVMSYRSGLAAKVSAGGDLLDT